MRTAYCGSNKWKAEVFRFVRDLRSIGELGRGKFAFASPQERGVEANKRDEPLLLHVFFMRDLGIPKQVTVLLQRFLDRLPEESFAEWVENSLDAIQAGSDLSFVHYEFGAWLLGLDSPSRFGNGFFDSKGVISATKELLHRLATGENVSTGEWSKALASIDATVIPETEDFPVMISAGEALSAARRLCSPFACEPSGEICFSYVCDHVAESAAWSIDSILDFKEFEREYTAAWQSMADQLLQILHKAPLLDNPSGAMKISDL